MKIELRLIILSNINYQLFCEFLNYYLNYIFQNIFWEKKQNKTKL